MIKVRIDGQVMTVPAIKGTDGKSAYQYAVDAGFEGTEQEFNNLLVNNSNIINTHVTDAEAHSDIRELISALQEEVTNIEVNGGGSSNEVNDATKQYIDDAIEAAIGAAIAASY